MIEQLASNWLCWSIILLAMVCYYQLWLEYLGLNSQAHTQKNNASHSENNSGKYELSAMFIAVLPLMGLLGTIMGMLDCFSGIANGGGSNQLVSSGIANALLTTQLGLVCAIPGWLLQAWVRRAPISTGTDAPMPKLQTE